MSVIYSAGQFDDAFCPRKLGNWEAGAKEACTYKFRKFYPGITEIIADSRGHLLPGIPRDKSQAWGLLSQFMQNKYSHSIQQTMAMMSGPGRQCSSTALLKRFKNLPKFNSKKEPPPEEQDLLLEYLQDLCLPIVWIIGPPTKNTIQKRKQFAKQLATTLGFGYVNLDEKIQEWKDRQTCCTCPHPHNVKTACNTAPSTAMSLASTSIAPSKLPTNVSPKISSELPVPPDTPKNQQNPYSLTMLDSQRIIFDTALPIERNKILELYKFAMAECLPCSGFIMDMVPFDLVEGLAFEKVFYPAALAIYFTEGVPQKKNAKPKDRRVTATACSSTAEPKFLRNPNDPKAKKIPENQFLKMKSHKRLGTFTLTEGEKICKQFGSKTIRIINAEDVERDTMEFLNELVRRNLAKYEQILNGEDELDIDQDERILSARSENDPPSSTYSAFIPEGREVDELDVYEEEKRQAIAELQKLVQQPPPPHSNEDKNDFLVGPGSVAAKSSSGVSNLPPALVTANQSETSLINFSSEHTLSSMSSTPVEEEHLKSYSDDGGAGDRVVDLREGSAELWEKIVKLETKVAEVNPEEERCQRTPSVPSRPESLRKNSGTQEDRLPPPTAFAEQEREDENGLLTTAIRKAMVPNFVPQERLLPKLRTTPPPPHQQEYDYGAGGDCGNVNQPPGRGISPMKAFPCGKSKPPSQQSSHSSEQSSTGSRRSQPSPQRDDQSFDR